MGNLLALGIMLPGTAGGLQVLVDPPHGASLHEVQNLPSLLLLLFRKILALENEMPGTTRV